jgi:hypothetical protein
MDNLYISEEAWIVFQQLPLFLRMVSDHYHNASNGNVF